MTRKKINPYYIQSIEVSMQDFSGRIKDSAAGMVLDDSQNQISSLDKAIKATMANIVSTVKNLDEAMNKVAEAFKDVDANIANDIANSTTYTTPESKRKTAADTSLSASNQQNSTTYKELP